MAEHEQHIQPEHHESPQNKKNAIAASIIVGSLLICGSIFYNTKLIVKQLASGSSYVAPPQNVAVAGNTATPTAPAAPTVPVTIADRANEPVLGNQEAKVTMVEFGDFQCPFCKEYFQQTLPDIKSKYVDTGKVKIIFRHYPLTQIHVNAQISAVAAECANQQGKFWQYHDLLYSNGQSDGTNLDKASLEKYADQLSLNAGTLGLGKNKFNQCLESNATLPIVNADQQEGVKAGVTGTPTFYINGVQLVGAQPASVFEQAIEAALKQ